MVFPQGSCSCLGPLLCIQYINDFENCQKSTIPNMYADDTCVNIASEILNELLTDLKNELEIVSNWMRINKLSLNDSKSEYTVIGHRRQLNKIGNDLLDLVVNNEVIKWVDKTNYPAINIDERLNWKGQYKDIKDKLKRGLNPFRNRKFDQVYEALFESHLHYCNIVWNTFSNTKLSQLQRLQTRAKKLIANAKYTDLQMALCKFIDLL